MVAAITSTITIAIMAYISYKYPFNNEKGQVTKAAKNFGLLVFLSIVAGGFMLRLKYICNFYWIIIFRFG